MPKLFSDSLKSENEQLNKADYIKWCCSRENALIVDKAIEDVTFSLQYKTPEYVLIAELKEKINTNNELEKLVKNNSQWQYFTFRVSVDNYTGDVLQYKLNSTNDFSERINYMTFNIQNDFSLVCCNDTFPCLIYHLERNFGTAPYCNMLLGFENPGVDLSNNCDKTLIYSDRVFNSGIIKLTVSAEAISKLPRLIF